MAQSEALETDERSRLLEAARALVLRGEQKFSISALCAEAGVPRTTFRAHFSGKTQLMAVLMAEAQSPGSTPAPTSVSVPAATSAPEPARPAESTPKAASELSVSTPDAWLERRLRVFERALTALEAKAEATGREQARVIAELEEKLARMKPASGERRLDPRPVSVPAPAVVAHVEPLESIIQVEHAGGESQEASQPEAHQTPETQTEDKPSALLDITPAPAVSLSREEIAEVVQLARGKARAAAATEPTPRRHSGARVRLLAIGGLALLVLFLCVGLSLGKGALATAATEGDGVAYRHASQSPLARTTALADAGDAKAQAKLALMYLKGEGVAADPAAALRWSRAAADGGQPVAQYLMGSFYRQDSALAHGLVPADAAAAFRWFEAAAIKGNLKAMHNLAIAYAQGLGAGKDETKAAEWFTRAAERGYVDSAFDLAVLYERGLGVTQDLKQALTWYGVAARMGDAPAEERVRVLRGQISGEAVTLAARAAENFTPVPPLVAANRL
jgi:TPR repeat protein